MNSLPSPAASPAPSNTDSQNTLTTQSRKRARSSISSVTSSSKRAMSEDPTTSDSKSDPSRSQPLPTANHVGQVTAMDDIDAYMMEQEAGPSGAPSQIPQPDLPNGVMPGPPSLPVEADAHTFYNDVKYILSTQNQLHVGETWYLVSQSWYRRWEKACTGQVDKEGGVLEGQVGPVDNCELVDNSGRLKAYLQEGTDVVYIPASAWEKLVGRYGQPHIELPRKVISRGINQETLLELYPLTLDLCMLEDCSPVENAHDEKGTTITVSSQDTLGTLYDKTRLALSVPPNVVCRLWRVDPLLMRPSRFLSTELKRSGGRSLITTDSPSISQTTVEDALLLDGDLLVLEVKNGDNWIVNKRCVADTSEPVSPPASTERTSGSGGALFSTENDFFSTLSEKNNRERGDRSNIASSSTSFQLSTIPQKNANGSVYGKGKAGGSRNSSAGIIGLSNMGNTCFMNSALQCLIHTKELCEYFLMGFYRNEINRDNPLGMGGAIAESFGALMERLWLSEGSAPFSPREFKLTLQRFAPQFSGYQQHDTQELVAFLLDGLHEDLNRVLKKPFVEKPDWEGGGDKELVELAKNSWEGYMKRNDSVIVDLFQGQYKSTLVCPDCKKVSITFDPFMYLTLPLPVQKKWAHDIYYVPWDSSIPHKKITVEVNRNASFKDVRQLLGRWMNVNPDNLLTLETFNHRFYKSLDDTTFVNEMQEHDSIVCFELPCHAQQSRTWKPDPDPTKNPLIVPVHFVKDTRYSNSYGRSGLAHPFVVVLSYEESRDKQKIYDAVVERLERWTVHAKDLYRWEQDVVIDEVRVKPEQIDSLVEIKENGDVVQISRDIPEGDISDEIATIADDVGSVATLDDEPVLKQLGPKPDLFVMHIQNVYEKYSVTQWYGANHTDKWSLRANTDTEARLLGEKDALFCEWDDHRRAYYFGDDPQFEHSLWLPNSWEEFVHQELKESRAAASAKNGVGINLLDCLEEFTKEEQLGEDDLWYCPRCKDHKQATKKFDIWTVPDILVVHLKRFSNSRILRDKIDAFVDFPIEGLDLGPFCVERQVAERLTESNVNVKDLGLRDLEEPLIYDLFAVDEHLGGLGGGHYRAYAKDYARDSWYHFDDSYVTPATPNEAINANAYLLFYRRRTQRQLGRKPFGELPSDGLMGEVAGGVALLGDSFENQLPTPPEEYGGMTAIHPQIPLSRNNWPESDNDEQRIDDSQFIDPNDPMNPVNNSFVFPYSMDVPGPSITNSPSSSVEVEPDMNSSSDIDDNQFGEQDQVDPHRQIDDWPPTESSTWGRNGSMVSEDTHSTHDQLQDRTK